MHDHQHMPGTNMGQAPPAMPAEHTASGTSVNPRSSPMDMIHKRAGSRTLMLHGIAFITEVRQTGPRGRNELFAPNWFMGTAEHAAGRGTVELRSMLCLDPATITNRFCPLLFQTGETALGAPIVDGLHPHD